ncbi:bifunctional phosphopantothenoylcysteine decarboxylase/phosphopantothenate--cysteine ligase CoaBC [Hydrogenimonas urashimensis]|uniref:bifunctional phosphopantothenoylcysteine decarboxylase/phosphopantothenate--cysteine ligase CoaBC n=1 Tax=Hydrogenimonas urashimensis TaxID=2740515 RepID=UPI0019159F87|nr:bifunctional phosphopantothenoylcysteine decarboxylase/phosphopantothenate--cysteine ligase CoaBC [Hydrogenimonas urashimensis]
MLEQVRLDGKKVLIGVSGSIAAYKTCDLVRLFVKAGADVRVVMTEAAKRFVSPLTFEALSGRPVLHEASESWADDNNHIGLGEWADLFIVAPASANTINKMSAGIADNLLLQTALAFPGTILLAPAANTRMIEHPITVANMKRLTLHRIDTVEPQTKMLACNTVGKGAMAEPETIFATSLKHLFEDDYWKQRRVVVTGGGTMEKIDEVRYLSNFSSGKMAEALVTALYAYGADVCYVTTKTPRSIPPVHVIGVESAREMLEYVQDALRAAKKGLLIKPSFHSESDQPRLVQKTPWLFMAAAVSDYRPAYPQSGKLKKEALGETWRLDLVKNPDILKSLDRSGVRTLAFKAEMDETAALDAAWKLMEEKKVDAVALNILKNSGSFGSDTNAVTLVTEEESVEIPRAQKTEIAFSLLEALKNIP